ncbi:hypothetical protein [Sinanaerobacter sp. ZZT-01]|uniref:hypothetical protein n=1 Tax=Sinanaerobacter sp. ZZT-01 TaxID=3111540 RepID=UPI002D77381A|nr:hypothetical protein [Sinanaerobacter sp. ZZT-01]WRR94342.1 hypothetical protein U5921_04265 [Sinanaerobacter sp. ZZT-01]
MIDNANLGGHIINHYRKLFGERIDGVMMELRYTKYIDNRYFSEEELTDKNEILFQSAKQKLAAGMTQDALAEQIGVTPRYHGH